MKNLRSYQHFGLRNCVVSILGQDFSAERKRDAGALVSSGVIYSYTVIRPCSLL